MRHYTIHDRFLCEVNRTLQTCRNFESNCIPFLGNVNPFHLTRYDFTCFIKIALKILRLFILLIGDAEKVQQPKGNLSASRSTFSGYLDSILGVLTVDSAPASRERSPPRTPSRASFDDVQKRWDRSVFGSHLRPRPWRQCHNPSR